MTRPYHTDHGGGDNMSAIQSLGDLETSANFDSPSLRSWREYGMQQAISINKSKMTDDQLRKIGVSEEDINALWSPQASGSNKVGKHGWEPYWIDAHGNRTTEQPMLSGEARERYIGVYVEPDISSNDDFTQGVEIPQQEFVLRGQGASFMQLPKSAGWDEEEDIYKMAMTGPVEDYVPPGFWSRLGSKLAKIPEAVGKISNLGGALEEGLAQRIVNNGWTMEKSFEEDRQDLVPEEMVTLIEEDAKTIAQTNENTALRDSQLHYWDRIVNTDLQSVDRGKHSGGYIQGNKTLDPVGLEKAIIETVVAHSGALTEYGTQEEFYPEIFGDVPPEERERLIVLTYETENLVREWLKNNPDGHWSDGIKYAMEYLQKNGWDATRLPNGFVWSDPVENDIAQPQGESEDPEGIQRSLEDMLGSRAWLEQQQKEMHERAKELIPPVSDQLFDELFQGLDSLDEISDSDDPIVQREHELKKIAGFSGFVKRLVGTIPAVIAPDGTWTKEGNQLAAFLFKVEELGIIDDATDLEGSLEILTNLNAELEVDMHRLSSEIVDIQNPVTQYQQAVLYFFNDRFGNRFDDYNQVAAHVKDVLFNRDKYSKGYRANVLSTFNSTHKTFSQLIPEAENNSATQSRVTTRNNMRSAGNKGGADNHGYNRDIGDTFWTYWDTGTADMSDQSGLVAQQVAAYYDDFINSVAKKWQELSGEELYPKAMDDFYGSIVLEGGKLIRSDVSKMDPVLYAAYSSALLEDYINHPTNELPMPIKQLGEHISSGIGFLNDTELYKPEYGENRLHAHKALTTLRILFGRVTDTSTKGQMQEMLGLDDSQYAHLKLWNDYLMMEPEGYWANPGNWYSEREGDEDLLLLHISEGRDIISSLASAMATVFEGASAYKLSQIGGGAAMFGADNPLDEMPWHTEDAIVLFMEGGKDAAGLDVAASWPKVKKVFEKANVAMPKNPEQAREWLKEMLKDPATGETRPFFGVNSKTGENMQKIIMDAYPEYGIAVLLSMTTRNHEAKSRMITFLDAFDLAGAGHKPSAVQLFKMTDYFSLVGDGAVGIHVDVDTGTMAYSTTNFDGYAWKIGDEGARSGEDPSVAAGRIWANPPTSGGPSNYGKYLRSDNTRNMLKETFLTGEEGHASDYWGTWINKLGLDTNDKEAKSKWNSFISTTIDEVMNDYDDFFFGDAETTNIDNEVYKAYQKQYGNDGFPGNLDLTLEVMRRVFEAYPQTKSSTGDSELNNLLGMFKETMGVEPITINGKTIRKYRAEVIPHPPTNNDTSSFRGTPLTQFNIIFHQALGGTLKVPFPISMHEDHFYYNRKTYKGLGADVIPVEAGMLGGYISEREQKESLKYLKLREELSGQPATLRSGTTIIGGTVVEN